MEVGKTAISTMSGKEHEVLRRTSCSISRGYKLLDINGMRGNVMRKCAKFTRKIGVKFLILLPMCLKEKRILFIF